MIPSDVRSIPDGARAYLVPVGFVYGGRGGRALGATGRRFLGLRLIIRFGETILVDQEFPVGDPFDNFIEDLPAAIQIQISERLAAFSRQPAPLSLGEGASLAYTRPLIMGVLNVTPDSFSDGGINLDHDTAIRRARAMIAEGAHIIDIGGESTRPGAKPVWEGEEAARVIPVIEALAGDGIPISVDSRHSTVMDKALAAGAHIINDVSALTYDPDSINIAAQSDAPVILMHSQGLPETMQDDPYYNNVILDVYDYLEERIKACELVGIARERIILDPGIGFGKRVVKDNLALINNIALFHGLGCPLLLGASRKRFIEALTGESDAARRAPGSIAAAIKAAEQGVQIFRVHDVAETAQALKMVQGFADHAVMDMRD